MYFPWLPNAYNINTEPRVRQARQLNYVVNIIAIERHNFAFEQLSCMYLVKKSSAPFSRAQMVHKALDGLRIAVISSGR